ncbi:hypothetical protein D3C73_1141950 [compost metagenome]
MPTLIHCCPFVTPGRSPVAAMLRPAKRLIKVDLPTFGIPTIRARTARGLMPLANCFSIFSFSNSLAKRGISLMPCPLDASAAIAKCPSFLKNSIHCFVTCGSARSDLFRTIRRGLPCKISSIIGFLLDCGNLASTNSITTSISFSFS